MSEYKPLKNHPLKFVLAEFRFSPVMQIAEFVPMIQGAVRKKYPITEKRGVQNIQIQQDGVSVSTKEQWAFIASNRKCAIEINQDRLVYVTTDYSGFPDFSDACGQAVEKLIEIVEPMLIFRIGLRYSDLVIVENGEKMTELVNDHFGLPTCMESLANARHYTTDTLLHTDMGGLTIRTLYGNLKLTCFPDVRGLPISIMADTRTSERLILDFDHYWEAKEQSVDFEKSDAMEKLGGLHEITKKAFWQVTTEYARNEKWS